MDDQGQFCVTTMTMNPGTGLIPGECICFRRPSFLYCSKCGFTLRGGRKSIKCSIHPELRKSSDLLQCPGCIKSKVSGTEKEEDDGGIQEYFVSLHDGKTKAVF